MRIIAVMYDRFEQSKLVFDGKIAKGYRVELKMDDGRLVQRDFFKYPGAAVILPALDDGSIVLIRNYRFAVDEHLYELPAGMIEPGEDPDCCAGRELTEETGYTAGKLTKLTEFYSGPGTTDEKMRVYLATELKPGPQALEGYERISVETHSDQAVRAMVADGTIHDAKTIATLGVYWLGKVM
ncbi:MAG: NUDIX hydrolase [Phycisphaerae bacterium]|nr:NUDIX hydrolase [Phycisphaerae bacterium]